MKFANEITVVIETSGDWLDAHRTIMSVLGQTISSNYIVHIYLSAPKIDHSTEAYAQERVEFFREKNIKIGHPEQSSLQGYYIKIQAGTLISRTFFYKAIEILKRNELAAVSPEVTLKFDSTNNDIVTIGNQNRNIFLNELQMLDLSRNTYMEASASQSMLGIAIGTCCATVLVGKTAKQYEPAPVIEIPPHIKEPEASQKKPEVAYPKRKTKFRRKLLIFIGKIARKNQRIYRLGKKLITIYNRIAIAVNGGEDDVALFYISETIKREIDNLGKIDVRLYGHKPKRFTDKTSETIIGETIVWNGYIDTVNKLGKNSKFNYIMILPWAISGGADLFAVNYANTIVKKEPNKRLLILTTSDAQQTLNKSALGLSSEIEILNLPELIGIQKSGDSGLIRGLLESIVNSVNPEVIHIILSKSGYDLISARGARLKDNGVKIILTGYNYLRQKGKAVGYSVEEIPDCYKYADLITTDNLTSKKLWVSGFGFNEGKILVHNQLMPEPRKKNKTTQSRDFRILWAAHIRPEKNPETLVNIAKGLLYDRDILIDCYGALDKYHYTKKNPFDCGLTNLHYKGAYSDFFHDINTEKYDAFVYTSSSDGTPNVLLEAAITKIPIVSSAIGGIPGLIKEDGILIEDPMSAELFISAIKNIKASPRDARKRANRLYDRVGKKYSEKNFDKQIEEMLKEVEY